MEKGQGGGGGGGSRGMRGGEGGVCVCVCNNFLGSFIVSCSFIVHESLQQDPVDFASVSVELVYSIA